MFGCNFSLGFIFILIMILVSIFVIIISIVYWIIAITQHIRGKKEKITIPVIITLITIILFCISPLFGKIGEQFKFSYAGLENIRKDANKLMASVGKGSFSLNKNEYPKSFRKIDGSSVIYSQKSLTIYVTHGVFGNQGIIIYSTNSYYKSGKSEKQIAPGIYKFCYPN